jgi:hypothetical protein
MEDIEMEIETPSECWESFTNNSPLFNFLEFPTKLSNITQKVERYIEEIPNMFSDMQDQDLTPKKKEVIKEKLLTYIDTQLKTHCLNCFHPQKGKRRCPNCGWINDLDDTPAANIEPITYKTYSFKDFSPKIAYPPIDKAQLKYLPKGLKKAVETFLQEPEHFTLDQRRNIYHNLFKKDPHHFKRIWQKYKAKEIFARFIRDTNMFASE